MTCNVSFSVTENSKKKAGCDKLTSQYLYVHTDMIGACRNERVSVKFSGRASDRAPHTAKCNANKEEISLKCGIGPLFNEKKIALISDSKEADLNSPSFNTYTQSKLTCKKQST